MLVNNAGLMAQTPVLKIEEAEWDRLFSVNLRATFFLTQSVARRMAANGAGAVVSISSVNALRTESPEAHYNATKAGIVAIMRSFANELSHLGLRFNCVAPGETVSAEEAAAYTDEDRSRTREYLQRVPLRRVSRPSEQAASACSFSPPTMPPTSTARRSSSTAASSAATGTTRLGGRRSPTASRASRANGAVGGRPGSPRGRRRSASTRTAQLRPFAPVTPPPGWVPAPHM